MDGCIFCKIARGETRAHVVYEDPSVIAFLDVRPRNPGHTLVIPKKHFETIFEIDEDTVGDIYRVVRRLAPAIVRAVGANGVNTIQSNVVSQGIGHFHTHIVPRFFNDGMPVVWESFKAASDGELIEVWKRVRGMM